MEIRRNKKLEQTVYEKARAWLAKQPRSEGLHVSDLLTPLKSYYRMIDPKPYTNAEIGYFIAGQGHHYVIEALVEGSEKMGKADAGSHQWEGIWYSPDIKSPHPIEIKTSRSRWITKKKDSASLSKAYEQYLKQLSSYMAIEKDTAGMLFVFYLALEQPDGSTLPVFRCYTVEMTEEEIDQKRLELLGVKGLLEEALHTKDPKNLPLCPGWLCRSCAWREDCKPWEKDKRRKK